MIRDIEKFLEGRVGYPVHDQLGNMEKALKLLGNPHKGLKTIHLAGTNGKGSTTRFLAGILQEAGLRVGSYTSPHIIEINDRIRVDNSFISDDDFKVYMDRLRPVIRDLDDQGVNLRYFEILTLLAILYFKDQKVDVALMEAGVGGRYDATNIMEDKLVSLIMNIGYDHMNVLGDSLEQIAWQKAGIIDDKALIYPMDKRALGTIEDYCQKEGLSYRLLLEEDMEVTSVEDTISFNYKKLRDLRIPSQAVYQVKNASMALMAAQYLSEEGLYKISEDQMRKGLLSFSWEGRMELISKEPRIILDGAHNPLGIRALKESLDLLTYDRLIIIVASLKDKDYQLMAESLGQLDAYFIVSQLDYEGRSLDLDQLKKVYPGADAIEDKEEALARALEVYRENDLILVTGSLYFVADFRRLILARLGR